MIKYYKKYEISSFSSNKRHLTFSYAMSLILKRHCITKCQKDSHEDAYYTKEVYN